MTYYKSKRPIDGKRPIWVIVDETGKIVNRNPTKDELKGVEKEILPAFTRGNSTRNKIFRTCCTCKSHDTYIRTNGSESWFKHKCEKSGCTGFLCLSCYRKEKYKNGGMTVNLLQSIKNCRTNNQNPNHEATKGDNTIELACILYGWEDLNKKYDNYTTSIDCYDPKTGLYHQIQGRCYSMEYGRWPFGNLKNEWDKTYENMICFCFDKDWNIVKRIYKFPQDVVVEHMTGINIVKNPSRGISWYEGCRETNEDELRKANELWKEILERRNKMQNTRNTTKCTDKELLLEGDK